MTSKTIIFIALVFAFALSACVEQETSDFGIAEQSLSLVEEVTVSPSGGSYALNDGTVLHVPSSMTTSGANVTLEVLTVDETPSIFDGRSFNEQPFWAPPVTSYVFVRCLDKAGVPCRYSVNVDMLQIDMPLHRAGWVPVVGGIWIQNLQSWNQAPAAMLNPSTVRVTIPQWRAANNPPGSAEPSQPFGVVVGRR